MAQPHNMKARALVKDEIILLLDLISKHKILFSKSTNAANNKLKEDAWQFIAQEFGSLTGAMRRPEQLRLKWENLKKAARKRCAIIKQNNLKTGGEKTFIPPQEIFDRVASILGATYNGFTVECDGDKTNETAVQTTSEPDVEVLNYNLWPELPHSSGEVMDGNNGGIEPGCGNEINYKPKKFIFNTPKHILNKRRKLAEDVQRARRDKDRALAAYFNAKAEKVRLENIKLELEIKQLKNKADEQ